MLAATRSTRRRAVWSTRCSMVANSAASASGSQNGWPGASISDTPPSGSRNRTGPSHALSLSAISSPNATFSSTVVRISVTSGLCTWRRRPSKRSGTVARAPKLTMSSAPHEPT